MRNVFTIIVTPLIKPQLTYYMNYNGFPYLAAELSAFAVTCGIFVISLKNGKIVHFTPEDENHFYNWLMSTQVREVVPAC